MLLYTARKGDTLVTIADRFGVSLDQLRRWNKMTGIKVEPGRRLHVAEAANVPHAARSHRRGSSVGASKEAGSKARAKGASAEKGVDKGPAASKGHKRGHASAVKNDHAEKPATAATAKKSGISSAKSSHAQGPATKQKSAKKKQK
jgi:membrane-bound lytic murein transglycosylase D